MGLFLSGLVTVLLIINVLYIAGFPIYDPSTGQLYKNISNLDEIPGYNLTNGTKKQLYVIKAVVYEIGVLTEVDDNDTLNDDYYDQEGQKQVDLTFYNAHQNGSEIDFGDIPLPIQQQLDGQVLTGIIPFHIGTIQNPLELLRTLPLTGTLVNITDEDNAVFNIHTQNVSAAGEPTVLHEIDFEQIPVIDNSVVELPDEIENAPIFNQIPIAHFFKN